VSLLHSAKWQLPMWYGLGLFIWLHPAKSSPGAEILKVIPSWNYPCISYFCNSWPNTSEKQLKGRKDGFWLVISEDWIHHGGKSLENRAAQYHGGQEAESEWVPALTASSFSPSTYVVVLPVFRVGRPPLLILSGNTGTPGSMLYKSRKCLPAHHDP
jgi:hypothetical protein